MAEFEHIVAIKWNTPSDIPYESMRELVDDFNIMDNSSQPGRCFRNGGQGFLDHLATTNPSHELEIVDLLESGRFDEGQARWDHLAKSTNEFSAKIWARSGGVARTKKAAMAIMGHHVGSMRPQSLPLDEGKMAELRCVLASADWPIPEVSSAVPATA